MGDELWIRWLTPPANLDSALRASGDILKAAVQDPCEGMTAEVSVREEQASFDASDPGFKMCGWKSWSGERDK